LKTQLPSLGAHDRVAKLQASATMIPSSPARCTMIAGCRYRTAFPHSLRLKRLKE
jgi:hypothetical protein